VRVLIVAVVAALGFGTVTGALERTLDRRAIEEALDIARSTIQSIHRRFHADYRLPVAKPPIDFVEIVTPFRRVVLAAESDLRLGRRMFGQREALAALQPDPQRIEVFVELTFHPMNTFVGVPAYDVELRPVFASGTPLQPGTIDRLPRFGPRMDDADYLFPYPYVVAPRVPSGTEPLLGGTLISRFNGAMIDPKGIYEVVVKDGTSELGKTPRIDLLRLR
jgi:hypothetical protein